MQKKGKNKAVATGSESLRVDNRADFVPRAYAGDGCW